MTARLSPAIAVHCAQRLIGYGRYPSAARLLKKSLERFDPVSAPGDPDLIIAATLFARVGDQTPNPRLDWALYAEREARHACGRRHELAVDAAEALAYVLQEQGLTGDAITVREHLAETYDQLHNTAGSLASRRNLADLLHHDGRCDQAEQQIQTARRQWHPYRDIPRLRRWGARIVVTHAGILAGCGHHHTALALLRHTQLILDPVDPDRRAADGVPGYLALTDSINHHPPICTRPPPAAYTAEQVQAHCAEYRRLLYDTADH